MSHWPRIISGISNIADAPLRGSRLLWTRPEESGTAMPEAIAAAGADVVLAPAIELRDLAARNIEMFLESLDHLRHWHGWLILPSPGAVRSFGRLLALTGLGASALEGIRVAAVGSGSASAVEALGIAVDFTPPEPTGANLASTLPGGSGTPVMVAGSSQSRPELQDLLKKRGFRVQFLALYDTYPCPDGLKTIAGELSEHPDALVLAASPSAAESIADWYDDREQPRPDMRWIAIGPTTRQRLLDLGVAPDRIAMAVSPDAPGVIAAAARLLGRPEAPQP